MHPSATSRRLGASAITAFALLAVAVVPAHALEHAARGKDVQLKVPANPRYPGANGPASLTDGLMGDPNYKANSWVGYEGPDLDATIDLGQETRIRTLAGSFLQVPGAGIFLPTAVRFDLSSDGETFQEVATITHDVPEREAGPLLRTLSADGLDLVARFVRIHAASIKKIPDWHPRAAGIPAWLFTDEILVNPEPAHVSALKALKTYEFGQSRVPLATIEGRIRALDRGNPEDAELLGQLVGLLAADTTLAAKRFVCRQLLLVGSRDEVPALAPLLLDPALSDVALLAVAHIPGDVGDNALLAALPEANDNILAGLLATIGDRRCSRAVPQLIRYAGSTHPEVSASALTALACIGNNEAAQGLLQRAVASSSPMRTALATACLGCADRLSEDGRPRVAATLYGAVSERAHTRPLRAAALGGLLRCRIPEAPAALIKALTDPDHAFSRAALSLVRSTDDAHIIGHCISAAPRLPALAQASLLTVLADRREPAAAPLALTLAASADSTVRQAAVRALGRLGDQTAVAVLLGIMSSSEPGMPHDDARHSLASLRDEATDRALVQRLPQLTAPTRASVLGILAQRQATGQSEAVVGCLGDADATVRSAAFKALGALGRAEHVPALVKAACTEPDAGVAKRADDALVAVCQRAGNSQAACTPVLSNAQSTPDPKAKERLFAVIGRLGVAGGEHVLSQGMDAPDADVRKAAIRAFSAWPTDAAIAPLMNAATAAPDAAEKLLALRTAVTVCGLRAGTRPAATTLTVLQQAMQLTTQDALRKQVLGVVAKVADLEALRMATACLGDAALRAEAESAVIHLAAVPALRKSAGKLLHDALQAVISTGGDATRKQKAQELLKGVP